MKKGNVPLYCPASSGDEFASGKLKKTSSKSFRDWGVARLEEKEEGIDGVGERRRREGAI